MIETKIRKYINYLGDVEYIAEIVTSPGAVDSLVKLLQSEDDELMGDICGFIRDFVLTCSRNLICKKVWESELESAIISTLENLVLADNHFTRKQVIYTLGKICSYDSIPVMLNAFYQLRDRDPLLLPRLIGELFWLGVDEGWNLIDSMAASNQYTTRWAIMTALHEFNYDSQNEDEVFLMRYKFSNQLRHDTHHLVREEAEYDYQFLELQRRKHRENITKSDYKKQRKALKILEPTLSFYRLKNKFSHYMYDQNIYNYTLEELENYINVELDNLRLARKLDHPS